LAESLVLVAGLIDFFAVFAAGLADCAAGLEGRSFATLLFEQPQAAFSQQRSWFAFSLA
jgi:hypothetical protein